MYITIRKRKFQWPRPHSAIAHRPPARPPARTPARGRPAGGPASICHFDTWPFTYFRFWPQSYY